MLTDRQKIARQGKITASRIGVLTSGDARAVYDLWLELTGDPSYTPPDLSDVWAVQLGAFTEQFHLDWIERSLGSITSRGKSFQHQEVPWALCTLDGWINRHSIPIEAKHTGGFEGLPILIDRYMPQLQWIMWCTKTDEVVLSVIMGAKEPQLNYVRFNRDYTRELIDAAEGFMNHVWNLSEPVANPYIKPPKPVFSRVVDMTGNNQWGTNAAQWMECRAAHLGYEEAAKTIKGLVPADAKEAFGHSIKVSRSKAGSLTIRTENDNAE